MLFTYSALEHENYPQMRSIHQQGKRLNNAEKKTKNSIQKLDSEL